MRISIQTGVLVLMTLGVGDLSAAIVKCTSADGAITYTDTSCAEGVTEILSLDPITPMPLSNVDVGISTSRQLSEEPGVIAQAEHGLEALASQWKQWQVLWSNPSPQSWPARIVMALRVLTLYVLMSLWCFFAYRRDKLAAINDEPRTPERRLHFYELLGGWPGAWLAQRWLRHKTRKQPYQAVFWLIVLLHLGLLVDYFLLDSTVLGMLGAQVFRL